MAKPQVAFGKVLRKLRTERNLSQEKVALEANIDRTFVSMLERGIKQPSLNTIIAIAAVLAVSPSELVAAIEQELQSSVTRKNHEDS